MSRVVIGCCVAVPRSHWLAVPTPLFDNISQLFGDSFSVSQQPPICEFPSHSSLILWLLMWLLSLWSQLQCVGGWWTGALCCTRSTSSGGGINKTLNLTMVSRPQVNNEYKIMDLVHTITNFSQQNLIIFIRWLGTYSVSVQSLVLL